MHGLRVQCQQRLQTLATLALEIAEPPEPCPCCAGPMRVQKTQVRRGRTLAHGAFEARQTVYVCAAGCRWPSGVQVTQRAGCLEAALLPHAMVGYDVMVFVGLQRFLHHRQREEIQAALREEHGIALASGELSALARRFTEYVARLQEARAGELKAALEADGGYPLHVDATGEAGRGTLLLAMAGWRQWVLGAWKVATERADLIGPCLRHTVQRFGAPCALVRDLGRAMIPALDELAAELERPIPVLACHQHFLADVGKDLLEPAHGELRALFRRTKVKPKLRELVRGLGRELGPHIEAAREAVRRWQALAEAGHRIPSGREGLAIVRALAQWTLDANADASGLDFPFDRPYLDLYGRCLKAQRAADAFLRSAPPDRPVVTALKRLHRYLEPLASEVPFRQVTERLHRRAMLFDELRAVLRPDTAPEDTVKVLTERRKRLDALGDSLRKRRPARGPAQDTRNAIDLILAHLDTHGPYLWGHTVRLAPPAAGVRLVPRTNALVETFFGDLKHRERRRSGRKNLGQDLEHLPAEATLVCNFRHADYVRIVCGSLEDLAEAFAELDREERERRLNALPTQQPEHDVLAEVLQIASASLSPADRRVVRTREMDRRVAAAAASRAPRQ